MISYTSIFDWQGPLPCDVHWILSHDIISRCTMMQGRSHAAKSWSTPALWGNMLTLVRLQLWMVITQWLKTMPILPFSLVPPVSITAKLQGPVRVGSLCPASVESIQPWNCSESWKLVVNRMCQMVTSKRHCQVAGSCACRIFVYSLEIVVSQYWEAVVKRTCQIVILLPLINSI